MNWQNIKDDDVWSGLSDPKERRKRQNRLHQRAWRQRQASIREEARSRSHSDWQIIVFDAKPKSLVPGSLSLSTQKQDSVHSSGGCYIEDSSSILDRFPLIDSKRRLIVAPIIPYVTPETLKKPRPQIIFPLSPDHHLITLVQYNVARAMLTLASIVPWQTEFPLECSGVYAIGIIPRPDNSENRTLPSSLQPTAIQLSVPHEPWIDVMPFPAMRDTLILCKDTYDEDDLCCDLMGGLFEGFDDIELKGVMVWSDPWTTEGWEVTEGFARKWGFLLKGCEDLMKATDLWRERRGLDPLELEVGGEGAVAMK